MHDGTSNFTLNASHEASITAAALRHRSIAQANGGPAAAAAAQHAQQ